ncbi:hypothetical protein M9H77_00712 [Catharanthus roseus]|uniref:Uncharacterized protein n=1 Tax=Catharanthus roseus TaxID=4058 RepID=A0ACC0C3M4_CATRO|nr:hypothetical protein M9H77_00712 [Catharanthus roseus]
MSKLAITTTRSSTDDDDRWPPQYHHNYQNQSIDEFSSVPFSDSISVIDSPNRLGNTNELSPRGKNIGKPPRRSRASRRTTTPTTLLNASIKNFRNLVQQYTGCQSQSQNSSSSSLLVDASNNYLMKQHKGPINLSFGSDYSTNELSSVGGGGGSGSGSGSGPGGSYYNKKHTNNQEEEEEEDQVYRRGQQGNYTFQTEGNNNNSNNNNGEFSGFGTNTMSAYVDNFGYHHVSEYSS